MEEFSPYKEVWHSEEKIIDILMSEKRDLTPFLNILSEPVDFEEFHEYLGFYIAKNILRKDLGFNAKDKPGDFDVLIIPYTNKKVFFERTAAYEVKIVRPTNKNPKKASNSLGVTQLKGLIQDGFPLVSLLHICMPEPILKEERFKTKFCTIPANSGIPLKNNKLEDNLIDVSMDTFPWHGADLQMKRLISQDIPKFAGIAAYGLSLTQNDNYVLTTCSYNFAHFQAGYFNPHKKNETIIKIQKHFRENPDKYYNWQRKND